MSHAGARQVDLYASKGRSLGLTAIGIGFLGVSLAYLNYSGAPGGSFAAFAMWGGVALGLVGIGGGIFNALRRGPVVSVGPRGIYDRRLSTDWIGWDAITSISPVTIANNSCLMLEIAPTRDAGLPIKSWARRLASMNGGIGFHGYAVSATALAGGFTALTAAVQPFLEQGPMRAP